MTVPALPPTPELERRLAGIPLVAFLDVDGTLAPIAPRPADVVIAPETRQALEALAAMPAVHVVVVSGRAATDARRIVDVAGAWVIGNHGIEIAAPGAAPRVRDDVAIHADAIEAAAARLEAVARDKPGVLVENKRWTLSAHYRLADPGLVPELASAIAAIAGQLGLRVTHGKKVLELRPPIRMDKGIAAVELARSLGALRGGSILCAGDDQTDEDAFRAIRAADPASVTVRVAQDADDVSPTTSAEFSVPNTRAMAELLQWLVVTRRRR